MKKFVVAFLCALGLFTTSAVLLSGNNAPVVASGYGIEIR